MHKRHPGCQEQDLSGCFRLSPASLLTALRDLLQVSSQYRATGRVSSQYQVTSHVSSQHRATSRVSSQRRATSRVSSQRQATSHESPPHSTKRPVVSLLAVLISQSSLLAALRNQLSLLLRFSFSTWTLRGSRRSDDAS